MDRVEYPSYCETCKKGPFAGNTPAQQHFNSQAHLSKEAQRNAERQMSSGESGPRGSEIYISECNACGKKFNNELSAEQHFASENHKKREAFFHSTESTSPKNSYEYSDIEIDSPHGSSYPSENLVDLQPRQAAIAGTAISSPTRPSSSSKNLPDYTFDKMSRKGFCNVCNLDLTSEEHAKQHVNGQKHLKAKQRFGNNIQTQEIPSPKSSNTVPQKEYAFDGMHGYCFVCKIDLTSHQHASQHLNGKPHAKAKASQSSSFHQTPSSSPQQSRSSSANDKSDIKQEYVFTGGRGFCYICNLELTSNVHAQQHLSGKSHEKAKQKVCGSIPSSLPLTCEICKKSFSGPECASQHFSSAKHLQKEALVKAENPTAPVANREILGAVATAIDKTQWVLCEVCNVRLNSVEQLNIHKNSPKHKAEEEKLARMGTNVEVMKTSDFNMDAIKPRFQVQNTGVLPAAQMKDIVGQKPVNSFKSSLSSFGPDSFLSNQPGMFAQELGKEDLTMGTFHTLDIHSILNEKPIEVPVIDFEDDTSPKVKYIEGQVGQTEHARLHEEKNLKEKCREKEFEKEMISDKMNTSSSSQSSFEMPELESIDSSKRNTCDKETKSKKDLENLTKKWLNSNEPRPPGAYPYDSLKSNETRCSSSGDNNASLSRIDNKSFIPSEKTGTVSSQSSLQQNVSSALASGHHVMKSNSNQTGTELDAKKLEDRDKKSTTQNTADSKSNSPIKGPSNSRSSGSALVTRVSNSNSRGGTKDGGGSTLLYDSSDSSDESDDQDDFFRCTSIDVQQRLQELGIDSLSAKPTESLVFIKPNNDVRPSSGVPKYYCEICKTQMNSKKSYKSHMEGRRHMQRVAVMDAQPRSHQPIVKEVLNQGNTHCSITAWTPRSYQWELYGRAMEGDRVIFLPTGTGKTLISCMAISSMLELNPTRQALFLVDKVLLVIQQSRYLVKQIGDRIYKRFEPENPSKLVERKLKIAALCGGQQSTQGVPIWQHDLIVVTAAYCEQLIIKNVLRWEDLCIVVFDEAHHCTKSHPFNKLLENNHLTRPLSERPKILGLTASPAGKKTFPITVTMLKNLMTSMGETEIGVTKEQKAELDRYQSSAKLIVYYNPMNDNEQKLQNELQMYLLRCFLRLKAETNILDKIDQGMEPREAKDLHGDILNCLEVSLNDAESYDQSAAKKIENRNLVLHTRFICIGLNTLFEAGVKTAVEELDELMALDVNFNFDFAKENNLAPDNLQSVIRLVRKDEKISLPGSINPEYQHSSKIVALIQTILNHDNIDWTQENPMTLVLVKERITASKISKILQEQDDIKRMGLKVTHLVGHGGGSGEGGGMAVNQQKKILRDIKHHKYHIVVATSVAEEGIDIPECELVITMNLPSSVTALVQMRGRARKEHSKFIVLCSEKMEEEKLLELLKREENMVKAANFLFDSQKRPE